MQNSLDSNTPFPWHRAENCGCDDSADYVQCTCKPLPDVLIRINCMAIYFAHATKVVNYQFPNSLRELAPTNAWHRISRICRAIRKLRTSKHLQASYYFSYKTIRATDSSMIVEFYRLQCAVRLLECAVYMCTLRNVTGNCIYSIMTMMHAHTKSVVECVDCSALQTYIVCLAISQATHKLTFSPYSPSTATVLVYRQSNDFTTSAIACAW